MSQFMKKSEVMDVRAAVEALQAAVIEGRKEIWQQQMRQIDQEDTSGKPGVMSGDQEAASAKQGRSISTDQEATSAKQEATSAKQGRTSADQKAVSAKQGVMSAEQQRKSAAEEEQSGCQQSGQEQSEGGARAEEDLQGDNEELKIKEIGRFGGEELSESQKSGSSLDWKRGKSGKEHDESCAQEKGAQDIPEGDNDIGAPAVNTESVEGSLNGVQGEASKGGESEEEKRWGNFDEEAAWYKAGRKRIAADYGKGEEAGQQEEAENVRHAKEDEDEEGQAGEVATEGVKAGETGGVGKGDTGKEQRGSEEGGEGGGVDKEDQRGASEIEDGKRTKAGPAEDEGSAEDRKDDEEEKEEEKELFGCGVAEIYRADELGAGRTGRTDVEGMPDLSEKWLKSPAKEDGTEEQGSQAKPGRDGGSESGTWERTAQALTHGWSGRPRLAVTEILREPAEPGFAESERARKGKAKVDDDPDDDVTRGTPLSDDDVTRLAWHRTEQLINERWGAAGPEYFDPGMTLGGESAASQIAEMAEQAQVVQVSKLGEGLMTAVKTVLGGTRDAVLGWKERIEDAVGGSPRSPAAGGVRGLGVLGDGIDAALEKTSEGAGGAAEVFAGGIQESTCDAINESISADGGSGRGVLPEKNGKESTGGSAICAGSGGGLPDGRRSTTAGSKDGKEGGTGYVALDEIDA